MSVRSDLRGRLNSGEQIVAPGAYDPIAERLEVHYTPKPPGWCSLWASTPSTAEAISRGRTWR